MPLPPGTRLGSYEIVTALGAGGMGEVYRARDSRLGRDVALKVLPASWSADPERLRRFEHEARAAAALSHPHIVAVYDVGQAGGVSYLAMELVEGTTLRDTLAAGRIPLKKTLLWAAQVADGLARAHATGIVHRDLKPENIMVTREGAAKILDFGLARRSGGTDELDGTTATRGTTPGTVLGTVGYMSPEQASGAPADFRSDQFSLGAILYEMLTQRRAFHRDTTAQTLSAIIESEPTPVAELIPETPLPLRWILERCLAKDPKDRYDSTRDLARDLVAVRDHSHTSGAATLAAGRSGGRLRKGLGWAAAAIAACLLLVLVLRWRAPAPESPPLVRLAIPLPVDAGQADPGRLLGPPAISPDGTAVVTALVERKTSSLWLRRFDSDRFERLAGTEGANFPFWSPDGRHIGFFADGKLKKMRLAGGETQALCDVSQPRGAAWSPSGFILYGVNYEGLFQVPEGGGATVKVRGLDAARGENSKRNPLLLPDGKSFIYFSRTLNEENRAAYLDSLAGDGRAPKRLVVPDGPVALGPDPASGHHYLLFQKDGKLWAQRFEVDRGDLAGEPTAILDDVGLFSVSASGTMVSRGAGVERTQLTWFDRAGKQLAVAGPVTDYWQMNVSPDDRLVAGVMHRSVSGYFAIWLVDRARGLASPFTAQTERSLDPVWSRDGRRLYFTRAGGGIGWQLYERDVDAAEPERPLLPTQDNYRPRDLSSDGRYLVGEWVQAGGRSLAYSTAGRDDWRPLPSAGSLQEHPQFSPDGRWVAYDSNESGTQEVYVMEFPTGRQARRISIAGGRQPRWRRDGRELFFHAADDNLMVVDLAKGAGLPSPNPSALFKVRLPNNSEGPHYGVSGDGQTIVAVRAIGEDHSRELNVVFNWPQLLRAAARQ